MTLYQCPRDDLGCTAVFPTTGDLDHHLRARHGYGRVWRLTSSLSRVTVLPVGPKAERRVPGGRADHGGPPARGGSAGRRGGARTSG
ncbi:hypothetical protein [Frankia sp. EAN1pec]|uniref:hypothetical protein n=1 Tax=Parafrankia sp. (strain EAN1pec) TaxID=298653 RepID=UPI0002E35C07